MSLDDAELSDLSPRFAPADGAVLDLASLDALARGPGAALSAWLEARLPATSGLVIAGLELEGEPAGSGPPGSVTPPPRSTEARVGPGTVVVRTREGLPALLRVDRELRAPWPTKAGPAVRGRLVLVPVQEPLHHAGSVRVAREGLGVRLGFIRPDQPVGDRVIPLAWGLGNGRDWGQDQQRLWQPEHPAVQHLLRGLESLETTVWTAEPEGAVWDRQILGRNWVRYQTVAAAALQSARTHLDVQATTSRERVRLLRSLGLRLKRSVERASTELLQLLGSGEAAGPYAAVEQAVLGSSR